MSQIVESLKNRVAILKGYSPLEEEKYKKSKEGLEDMFEYAKSKGKEIPKTLVLEVEDLLKKE
jgi:hypothetical protein